MAASMSWEEAKDRLKQLRDEQTRCSDEVMDLWEFAVADFRHKLGDELWVIYEQVCISACDCGRTDIAKECLKSLLHQFPDSQRVERLQGLLLESQERYEDAEKLYQEITEDDPANTLAKKRLIAVLKAQNKIPDAIKELNAYLSQYMGDYDAWMELCDLYLSEMDYAKACYCMEELMMSNPHNHLYYQRYAEIKYTQGGHDNMEMSRSYFSQSLKVCPNNVRSLFGLFMAASQVSSSQKSNAKAKKDNIKYAAWAADQIAQRYKMESRSLNPIIALQHHLSTCSLANVHLSKPKGKGRKRED